MRSLVYLILTLLAPPFCIAASLTKGDVAAHKERMDQAESLKYDLQDELDAKSVEKIMSAATQLVQLLIQEERYWDQAGLIDIAGLAKKSTSAARALKESARTGHLDGARSAFIKLTTACTGCHDQHPEKRVQVQK